MLSKACDITGIVAIACARHGCFAPNSVANLFRGEQQKNVDWAFVQACMITKVHPRQGVLLIYDIVCQYIIYLRERIGHLMPEGLDIDAAIGLFHIHGHKEQCFFRYATSFIPGAAVIAGEILESLWATLNAVTPAMRTATLAHRSEIMDDHMTDSNHKKALGLTASLSHRFTEAAGMAASAQEYYQQLTVGINRALIDQWETDIKVAEIERKHDRSVMDIMGATKLQGGDLETSADINAAYNAAPNAAPNAATGAAGGAASTLVTKWIQMAIDSEERQYVLGAFTLNGLTLAV